MKALVIGATGSTGKSLISQLSNDPNISEIIAFVRRDVIINEPKVKAITVDFDQPNNWKHLVSGDVAFSCLGTTLKDAGSKNAQWKIDYNYQFNFAKVAKENMVEDFILVSSEGASSTSKIFYSRMKGELEEAIKQLKFDKLTIFKPGMLQRPNSNRATENIALKLIKALNKLGILRSQKPLPTETLAQAMIVASKIKSKSYSEIIGQNIVSFAKRHN
ncbi:NAD(P)H-binding protein [Chryseobacterium sp. T1]